MADNRTFRQMLGDAMAGAANPEGVGALMQRRQEAQQAMEQWKAEQQMKAAQGGLMPNPNGEFVVGNQRYSRQPPMMPDLSKLGLGGMNGLGVTGATVDPMTGETKLSIGQTSESKIKEQSRIASAKEVETAIGKSNRLQTVGNTVKEQWLKTSPYKGLITKTGLVPVLGMWDVIKKGVGATSAQQNDQVYSNFVKGVRAQLARGMGDVGNLSETEQAAVVQLIPTLMDSYESGIKKFEQIAALVEGIRKTRNTQGYSEFTVDNKSYRIPSDKVEAFMKAKGLK